MKRVILSLLGMLGFMMIFPTTFLVTMNGIDLLPRVIKQIYALVLSI
ncbi:MAG: hypothetical protein AABY15_09735 [Nanoarchaeota archaeon]